MSSEAGKQVQSEVESEVEAINSIYGDGTIQQISSCVRMDFYLLSFPQFPVTLRLRVPPQYPDVPIEIIQVESTGSATQKGYGNRVLAAARDVLRRVFMPGQACLYDLIQELEANLGEQSFKGEAEPSPHPPQNTKNTPRVPEETARVEDFADPKWALSEPVSEKKSVFLGRACRVTSTEEVDAAIAHLLSTDKRAVKATHNISAYRIRQHSAGNEIIYQDCNNDGEDAAGARLLKLLQMIDAWNVLVVVSRWYGGIKLGPARFGIINSVAREAVISCAQKQR
ncbi:MAG: hypothetical protein LQ351_005365 [Letrouitia transgressa]|nr:MAG: hypothetical protein LQ351_005365 [Letrouitia transgressa]